MSDLMLLGSALENIGAYIFTKDLQRRYTYVNHRVRQFIGADLDGVVGYASSKFFDCKASARHEAADQLVLEKGQTVQHEEIGLIKPTGERRIYWTVKAPLRNPQGFIVGLHGISADISRHEQVKAIMVNYTQLLERALGCLHAQFCKQWPDGSRCQAIPMAVGLLPAPPAQAITSALYL